MPDDHKAAWLALRHAVDALESAEYLLSTVREIHARGVRQQIEPLRKQVSRWAAVLEFTRPTTQPYSLSPDTAGHPGDDAQVAMVMRSVARGTAERDDGR
jgi:hypothetical protein